MIPKKNIIYPKYFYWLLKAVKLPEKGYARHFKFLKSCMYLIPFRNGKPDLETQKKIVEYIEANFSKIDKILEKKKRKLEQLDELWESMLEQAFKPKEGEEWKTQPILECCDFIKGTEPGSKTYNKKGEGIPFIRVGNIAKGQQELVYTTSMNVRLCNVRDILIALDGSPGAVARGWKGAYASGIRKVKIKKKAENNVDLEFVYYFLQRPTTQNIIKNHATGAAILHASKSLNYIRIPLPLRNGKPDLEKQKQIASYLDNAYEKIRTIKGKVQNQINQLEEMKESILEEIFGNVKASN